MQHVTLKSGDKVPVLGLGTWRMGEDRTERAAEVAATGIRAVLAPAFRSASWSTGNGKTVAYHWDEPGG